MAKKLTDGVIEVSTDKEHKQSVLEDIQNNEHEDLLAAYETPEDLKVIIDISQFTPERERLRYIH